MDYISYLTLNILDNENKLLQQRTGNSNARYNPRPFREVSNITITTPNGSGSDIIRVPNRFILQDLIITGYDQVGNIQGISSNMRDLFEIQIESVNTGKKWSNLPQDITPYTATIQRVPFIPELYTNNKELRIEIYHRKTNTNPSYDDKIVFPAMFKVHIIGMWLENE